MVYYVSCTPCVLMKTHSFQNRFHCISSGSTFAVSNWQAIYSQPRTTKGFLVLFLFFNCFPQRAHLCSHIHWCIYIAVYSINLLRVRSLEDSTKFCFLLFVTLKLSLPSFYHRHNQMMEAFKKALTRTTWSSFLHWIPFTSDRRIFFPPP